MALLRPHAARLAGDVQLLTVPDCGLTSVEAAERLRRCGPNTLPEPPRRTVAAQVLDQLRDPMIVLLLAAAGLTLAVSEWHNTVIIVAVVVFNTAIGVLQQVRADRAMEELRRLAAPTAQVVRDGRAQTIPADLVVPGDFLSLAAGDVVAADGRALLAKQLQADTSHLTGESLPVDLGEGDEIVAGSLVTRGRGAIVVTRTGAESGVGRIAAALAPPGGRATPLQRRLARLSRNLVVVIGGLTAAVTISGLVQGRPWSEMLVVALSLAVAAVPESLPAVVTVALALGARRMARRNAVVRSLLAVETLGSVTVVATDKTGTITEGAMVVAEVWSPPGVDEARLLRAARLCNDARLELVDGRVEVVGDPLEGALLVMADEAGAGDAREWERIGEEPFDHHAKRMTTHHRNGEQMLTVCKGAPEVLVSDAAAREQVDRLTGDGLRVLAFADGPTEDDLSLIGLVGIGDPPRADAARVVRALERSGISLVLITGDHQGTAEAIARRVGITGPVYARVQPEQKVDVIEQLQRRGEIVAMLGDGVNDAAALSRADIGVAAGRRGSEVTKQAADLVLLDDDLGTVVAAVEEGRRIFTNIRTFLTFALSGGLAEVGVMLFGPLIGLVLPLLPAQILWINMLTHGVVGVAFGGEPVNPDEMSKPPRAPDRPLLSRRDWLLLLGVASVLTLEALIAGGLADEPRTVIFLALGLGQLGVALALGARPGRGLVGAVAASAALLGGAPYLPGLDTILGTSALTRWSDVALAVGAAAGPAVFVVLMRIARPRH